MFKSTKRETVTVDDRRAVMMLVKGRKPRDLVHTPNDTFIRRELKARMGWARNEPAPESIKAAAKEMALALKPKVVA